jgi:hypothetical protein
LAFGVAGDGPALVLGHGMMARGAMFEPLVELLAGDFMLIEDHAVPEHHFRTLTTKIPRVASHVVAGAGHTLVWTHTAVLAEIVRDWLLRA